MSLKSKKWNYVYRSGDQNILKEFYEPALESAIQYDRAVGYFSSEVLMSNLKGIASLVRNNGKMRLIIGHPLKEEEYQALKHGINTYRFMQKIDEQLENVIKEAETSTRNTLKLFAYLIAAERLEIKYAFRRAGMYHEKIGVITDKNGDKLVFQGSANETIFALKEGYNAESITVFRSWKDDFNRYGQAFLEGFHELWNNRQKNTVVMNMPTKQYERIILLTNAYDIKPEQLQNDINTYDDFFTNDSNPTPRLPSFISNRKFELMEHQKRAIAQWWQADKPFKGIFELATGSGKTITAISAATLLFEQNQPLALIISVPYIELAQQWLGNLNLFNIYPVQCWGNSDIWAPNLRDIINRFNLGALDFFAAVVVNRTLTGDRFQDIIKNVSMEHLMLIGDECHHFGGDKISRLAPKARFRLGLSATPFNSDEEEYESSFPDIAKQRILEYFHGIVATYTLEEAIISGVLCNYNYHILEVYLTKDEQEAYDSLSGEIAKLVAIQFSSGLTEKEQSRLSILTGQRSMLLGSAENKYVVLDEIAQKTPKFERNLSLFYCGAGHQQSFSDTLENEDETIKVIDKVTEVLTDNGWVTSQFTSRESAKERESRMSDFVQGHIDALVTIRVLDEGVDVPACKKAYLLASTKNKRQYIQRRGRVLRKFKGKDTAEIFDFITLPNPEIGSSYARALLSSELERIDEFSSLALNKKAILDKIEELGLRERIL